MRAADDIDLDRIDSTFSIDLAESHEAVYRVARWIQQTWGNAVRVAPVRVREDVADRDRFAACFPGRACVEVGRVTAEPRLVLQRAGRTLVSAEVAALKGAWKEAARG